MKLGRSLGSSRKASGVPIWKKPPHPADGTAHSQTYAMSVPRSRILALLQVFHEPSFQSVTPPIEFVIDRSPQTRCAIFRTTFNPQNLRLGNKVLRERLRGPSVAAYYPRRIGTIKQLAAEYPRFEVEDEEEEERVDKVRQTRLRGKGPPKKKKSKAGKSRVWAVKSAGFVLTLVQRARSSTREDPARLHHEHRIQFCFDRLITFYLALRRRFWFQCSLFKKLCTASSYARCIHIAVISRTHPKPPDYSVHILLPF
jgi:small subunit ribosomal protein S33